MRLLQAGIVLRMGDTGGRKATAPRGVRKDWGSVARRGAAVVGEDREHARRRAGEPERSTRRGGPTGSVVEWATVERVAEEVGRSAGGGAGRSGGVSPRRAKRLPEAVVGEVASQVEGRVAARVVRRLGDAAAAYDRERYQDAERMLVPLIRAAPEAPVLRELIGLCLYRQGKWGEAIRQLDEFRRLSRSMDQHPVLADCHRALGHNAAVRELWDELREASPSPELVAEGRIVMAESLAERGEARQAIALLERSLRRGRVTRDYHLRQWYALADLFERTGDLARARELFDRVASRDPALSDVAERAAALR